MLEKSVAHVNNCSTCNWFAGCLGMAVLSLHITFAAPSISQCTPPMINATTGATEAMCTLLAIVIAIVHLCNILFTISHFLPLVTICFG